jgi:ADP-ribose pyrophosphatase YjhB (NUDIX family)
MQSFSFLLFKRKLETVSFENYFKKVNPYFYEGENPSVDLIIINPLNEILLIKRSSSAEACPGMLALPGGFIDSKAQSGSYWQEDLETPKMAALRELAEETNLEQKDSIKGMDDADMAMWIPIDRAILLPLAFDHNHILEKALSIKK